MTEKIWVQVCTKGWGRCSFHHGGSDFPGPHLCTACAFHHDGGGGGRCAEGKTGAVAGNGHAGNCNSRE